MNILFLSKWFPWPLTNGSKLRIYNLLSELSKVHRITLLAFADDPTADLNPPELRAICADICAVPWRPFNPQSATARAGFLSTKPRSAVDTFSPEMRDHIIKWTSSGQIDLVIASQWATADYGAYFQHLPAIFEELELGLPYQRFIKSEGVIDRLRSGLSWMKHRHYIASLLRNFAACTVVSDEEKELLETWIPGYQNQQIEVIPNCLRLSNYDHVAATPEPNTLIFTGSFRYEPNYAAMCWFLKRVWPLVQASAPEARLMITGDHAGRPLPPAENVRLTGYVDDIKALIAASTISIAPIHAGGGTRLKILEAMALKTAVVSTVKGAEGLGIENGRQMLLADDPDHFATAIVRLLQDSTLRENLVNAAYDVVRDRFNWTQIAPQYLRLIDTISA